MGERCPWRFVSRRLRYNPCQLQLVEPPSGDPYLTYREDVSKTNQGGLKHRKKAPKEVIQYENKNNPERCIVKLFKKYNSKCPANRPDANFYLKPHVKPTEDCWYTTVAVGHNVLGKTVKRLLDQVGVQGHFTNHSLRASAATRLFEAGVDEQLIMMRTGHSSVTGARSYKRVGEKLRTVTSNVLNRSEISPKRPKIEDKENEYAADLDAKKQVQVYPSMSTLSKSVVNSSTVSKTLNTTARMPLINFGNSAHFTVNFNFSN